MSADAAAATMKACMLTDYCGAKEAFQPQNISLMDLPVPEPEEGEVQIKVAASSVNPVDWKLASGAMHRMAPLSFPLTLGFDCAGVVTAVGPEVERVKVGDEVWVDVVEGMGGRPGKTKLGAYAEFVVTKESKVGLKPSNLSSEQAAVVPLVGLTALQCLRSLDIQAGSSVLILGGAGGTGIASVQVAKALGATVYTTCSTRNLEFVKGLGADEVIDYTASDWSEVLKDKKIDGVFDAAGEKDGLTRALGVLKEGGKFTSINIPPPKEPLPNGITAQFLLTNADRLEDLDFLKGLCEEGKLSIKIDTSFGLDKIQEAFQTSMAGKVVGKISITMGSAAATPTA